MSDGELLYSSAWSEDELVAAYLRRPVEVSAALDAATELVTALVADAATHRATTQDGGE